MRQLELIEYIAEIDWLDSTNAKKDVIREIFDRQEWKRPLHIISGKLFEDYGVGKKTAMKGLAEAGINIEDSTLDEHGSLSKALYEEEVGFDNDGQIDEFWEDMRLIKGKSGNEVIDYLGELFGDHIPALITYSTVQDWNIGASDSRIANAIAEDKYDSYQLERGKGLSQYITDFAQQVRAGVETFEPQFYVPFKPMKADSIDELPYGKYKYEPKLDGYRAIICVDWPTYHAYSRNQKPIVESLPEIGVPEWPDGQHIFDAEILAEDGTYQTTSKRIGRTDNFENSMQIWIFDMIMHDGEDISRKPYSKRREIMEDTLSEVKDLYSEVVKIVPSFEIKELAVAEAKENDHEGLIAKRVDSEYRFGKRSSDWLKWKLTEETVDLRVVGFNKGEGERAGTLGSIDVETSDGVYMGSVGSGFDDEELDEIWEDRDFCHGRIAEIEFEGIVSEELRFPRFVQWRDDKDREGADSYKRVQDITR